MKKFSFISSVFVLTVVVGFLFIGCQKETTTADDSTINNSENTNIKAISGNGIFAGSIDNAYGDALRSNYINKFDQGDGKLTLQVAFSAKDLAAFINTLQTKNNADIIYVNFGVYGRNAWAPNRKDNGRLTVFFSGNKPRQNGEIKTNGVAAEAESESLNHGAAIPPSQ
jgi:hypothetical protein